MKKDKLYSLKVGSRLNSRLLPSLLATALLLLLSCGDLSAQMFRYLDTGNNATFAASGSMLYQPKTHVSGGGDITLTGYRITTGGLTPINDKLRFGVGLTYEFDDYNFSGLTGFAVPDPWNKVHRVGLSPAFIYKLDQNWNLFASPMGQYAAEQGADFNKSLMYGGAIGAGYRVNPNLYIGMAAGVFYRLEQTVVFPSLLVSWKITDQLRLGNPNRLGPSGPAGLELSYRIDKNWETAIGGGFRSNRFRLDRNGTTPSGIGQNASAPVYARIGRKLGPHFFLDVYGGAAFGGSLRLEDRRGSEIDSVHYNTAPIMGVTLFALF
jgi:hypothetical protein